MGAIIKLALVAVLAFGAYSVWKYGFASETGTSESGVVTTLSVTDKDWVKGTANAPATLIEYTDFQCPACGAYYPILDQLSKDLGDKMRFVVRHYPLVQIHKNALAGSRAAEAAGRQGKFWEMYDLLFANQKEWSLAEDPMMSILPAYAGRIGLDVEKFRRDMADATLDDKITADRSSGNELKITGTPTFFLNGERLDNPTSVESFKKMIEAAAK